MTAKYKIIGKVTRRKSNDLLGQYDVPVEVVELAADIENMEMAKRSLKRLRAENLAESREAAEKIRWSINNQIDEWLGYARGILKRQYLAK